MDFTNKLIYIYDTQKMEYDNFNNTNRKRREKKKKKSSKSLRYYIQLQKQSLCGTIYRLIS